MATFRLRVLSGNAAGTEYPLNAAEMTLGRSPDNYICIDDGNASRVHAKIQVIGGQAVLVDNKSRNGVYVNNTRVQQHTLRHGDRIGIGSTILEFHQLQAQPQVAQPQARQPQARQPQARQPRATGARPQPGRPITPQKNAGGGNNRLVLYGVAGLGLVAILGMVGYNMVFGGGGGGGGTTVTPVTRVTLEPLPTITSRQGSNFKENQLQARLYVDHGDSKRISDDLLGAYVLYGKAVQTDPSCDVCKSRMDGTRDLILSRVESYERGGQIAYDSGRYDEAAERWTRAIELLGNFSPDRTKALQRNVQEAQQKAQDFQP